MSRQAAAAAEPGHRPERGHLGRELTRPLIVVPALLAAALAALVEPLVGVALLIAPTVGFTALRWRRDAVTVLTVYVVVLFTVPSGEVIGPLGAAGRPASLLGIGCLCWWAAAKVVPGGGAAHGFQPVRLIAGLLLGAVLASYAAAYLRPVDFQEASAADRGLLIILGLLGPLLLAADGIDSRARLEVLVRRIVVLAAVFGGLGVLQFAGTDLSGVFDLPFLDDLQSFQEVQIRGDQRRISVTAAHPIEYGVLLALAFPFSLHVAIHASRARAGWWLAVGSIAAAIPMSVSRSGTLAFGITFLAMWFTWPSAMRMRAAAISVVFALAMRLAVPGLLGTIRSLFTNIANDDSTTGRTDDYGAVAGYISDAPLFGRGFGTFIPTKYFWLDNQHLGMLVDTGIVGATAFLLLFLVGAACARGARKGADEEVRSLGQALAGSAIASCVAAGTFDILGFGMAAGLSFLVLGTSGALWRLTADTRGDAVQAWHRRHGRTAGAAAMAPVGT